MCNEVIYSIHYSWRRGNFSSLNDDSWEQLITVSVCGYWQIFGSKITCKIVSMQHFYKLQCKIINFSLQVTIMDRNIVAAFRGMHVSPAKHSYAWLSRKCDYRTDRRTHTQTDAGQSDPYVPLCFAGDTKTDCSSLMKKHTTV